MFFKNHFELISNQRFAFRKLSVYKTLASLARQFPIALQFELLEFASYSRKFWNILNSKNRCNDDDLCCRQDE